MIDLKDVSRRKMTDTNRRVLLLVTWVHTNSELICEFSGETGRSGIIWTIRAALRSRSREMRNIVLTSWRNVTNAL
jgi:hypothetical protein